MQEGQFSENTVHRATSLITTNCAHLAHEQGMRLTCMVTRLAPMKEPTIVKHRALRPHRSASCCARSGSQDAAGVMHLSRSSWTAGAGPSLLTATFAAWPQAMWTRVLTSTAIVPSPESRFSALTSACTGIVHTTTLDAATGVVAVGQSNPGKPCRRPPHMQAACLHHLCRLQGALGILGVLKQQKQPLRASVPSAKALLNTHPAVLLILFDHPCLLGQGAQYCA